MFGTYERIGYPVVYASARTGQGVEELRDRLAGRISLVAGPSGVGKSTLLNAVQPGLNLATGRVSEALHKGRHTTTLSELLPVDGPMGGHVVGLARACARSGCGRSRPRSWRGATPICARTSGTAASPTAATAPSRAARSAAAVAAGAISPARLDSYHRLAASI